MTAQPHPVALSYLRACLGEDPLIIFCAPELTLVCRGEEEEEEEEEVGADKSNSLFFITLTSFFTSLLMRQGSKPGWSLEIYGRQKHAGHYSPAPC